MNLRMLSFACSSTTAFRAAADKKRIAAAFDKPPSPARLVALRDDFLPRLPKAMQRVIARLRSVGGPEYVEAVAAGVRWLRESSARRHKAEARALARATLR